jgi:hypothetical protein
MKALMIKNKLSWRDNSSVALGKHLDIVDSSDNLLIFNESSSEMDILKVIGKVSGKAYQLLDLELAAEDECEFLADSGTCYRQIKSAGFG